MTSGLDVKRSLCGMVVSGDQVYLAGFQPKIQKLKFHRGG